MSDGGGEDSSPRVGPPSLISHNSLMSLVICRYKLVSVPLVGFSLLLIQSDLSSNRSDSVVRIILYIVFSLALKTITQSLTRLSGIENV
jgi:hypothetical protein